MGKTSTETRYLAFVRGGRHDEAECPVLLVGIYAPHFAPYLAMSDSAIDSVFVTFLRSIGIALTSDEDSSQSSPNSCFNFAQMTGRKYIMLGLVATFKLQCSFAEGHEVHSLRQGRSTAFQRFGLLLPLRHQQKRVGARYNS